MINPESISFCCVAYCVLSLVEVACISLHRALQCCLFPVSTEHRNSSMKGVVGREVI